MTVEEAMKFRKSWTKFTIDGVEMDAKHAKKHGNEKIVRQFADYATSTLHMWTK